MSIDKDVLDKISILEETGQQFLDRLTALGEAERSIDVLDFHRWRVEASKLLCFSLGSSNYYYELFWKSVTRPELDHLREGLRLLATVKSELQAVFPPEPLFSSREKEAAREVVLADF